MIDSFTGKYRFLSNFFPCTILMDGEKYRSVEHAYQAAKTSDPHERQVIRNTKRPGVAKAIGKCVKLNPLWDQEKLRVMQALCQEKFTQEPYRSWLLETGDEELVEGNRWGDRYWGVCRGKGENHLGKILMRIRDNLRGEA